MLRRLLLSLVAALFCGVISLGLLALLTHRNIIEAKDMFRDLAAVNQLLARDVEIVQKYQGGNVLLYKALVWSSAGYDAAKVNALIQEQKQVGESLTKLLEAQVLLTSGDEKAYFAALVTDLKSYQNNVATAFDMLSVDFNAAAIMLSSAEDQSKSLDLRVNISLEKRSASMAADCATALHQMERMASRFLLITCCLIGSALAGTGVMGWMTRHIALNKVRPITDNLGACAQDTWQAAREIAQSSLTLAEVTNQQSVSLKHISQSVGIMASQTGANAANANEARELSKKARTSADAGQDDMQRMTNSMQAIGQSSRDVANILKTIDEIAFQTNILALNAAVEAARAGSVGAGFAIVAEEVRNLAQRSASAARETADKIASSVTNSTIGLQVTEIVANRLTEIRRQSQAVDDLVAKIAQSSTEQVQGISQINASLSEVENSTGTAAAMAEQTASAAEELNSQAQLLNENSRDISGLFGSIDTAVHGAAAHRATSPAQPALGAQTWV
jgi:methyl-accepting chemotaxis protein